MAKSPAAILYDETGARTGVTDNALRTAPDPVKVQIHSDATVTDSGSQVLSGYGQTELILFINIKSSPTGTTPALQYEIQEVDPGDEETLIGASTTSESFTDVGTQQIPFVTLNGGSVKISWTLTGTDSPSFTGVYATVLAKQGASKMLGVGTGASYPDPTGVYPEPAAGQRATVSLDGFGNLMTRGPVLTDENSFFDDFIEADVSADWTVTPTGAASYVVSNSILVLSSGTVEGDEISVTHAADYAPMTASFIVRVDFRQQNQETWFGFFNDPVTPAKRAFVQLSGTNPRLVQFVTVASSTQVEVSDINLSGGASTNEWHRYTIEIGAGYVVLRVDDRIMARHQTHIPGPYDAMNVGCVLRNLQSLSLSTNVCVDSVGFRNHNAVEIAGHFTGDPLRVRLEDDPAVRLYGEHQTIVVEHEGIHFDEGDVEGKGRELLAVADPEARSSLWEILQELRVLKIILQEMSGIRVSRKDAEGD